MGPKTDRKKDPVIQNLVTLGLTKLEVEIFLFILENPLSTFRRISDSLGIKQPSIHRSVSKLLSHKLVRKFGRRPIKLEVIDPSVSLPDIVENQYESQKTAAKSAIDLLKNSASPTPLRVELVDGKHETFIRSIDYVNQTNQDLIILSIGEPIPEELLLAIINAIRRGVRARMIAEKCDTSNIEMLRNLKKNGYEVRHLANPNLDFTLVTHDETVAMLHIRDQTDPEHRVGIFFNNPGYVKAQKLYLEELWDRAIDIESVTLSRQQ